MASQSLNDKSDISLYFKIVDDLEEILQCPVCFEQLTIPVPLCSKGHHICKKCQLQMPNNQCPFCKSPFINARNYLAELMVDKSNTIMNSLINTISRTNKQSNVSISTQTDFQTQALIVIETNNVRTLNKYNFAPSVGKGKYPCKIGNCNEELAYGRMLPHLRYYHKDELLEEKITNSCSYQNSWEFSYQIPNVLQQAIHIPNMGLFVLIISIDENGNLCGNLQIVNTKLIAREFEYSLEIRTNHNSITFKGQVLPTRSRAMRNVNERSLFVSNLYLLYLLKRNKIFTCHVVLNRLFGSEVELKKSDC